MAAEAVIQNRPVITRTSNGSSFCHVAQFNTFNVTLGARIDGTENYITPTSAGITLNGASYALEFGNATPIGSNATATSYVKLTGISYVPLQQTITIDLYYVPVVTPVVQTQTNVSASNSTSNNSTAQQVNVPANVTTTVPAVVQNGTAITVTPAPLLTDSSETVAIVIVLIAVAGGMAYMLRRGCTPWRAHGNKGGLQGLWQGPEMRQIPQFHGRYINVSFHNYHIKLAFKSE